MRSCGARHSFGNSFQATAIAVAFSGLLANAPTYSKSPAETCPPPPPQAKHWLELNDAAEKAYYNKDFPTAANLFEQALAEAEKEKIEIERARTLNSFGVLKKDEKKYPEAEKMLTEALAIREKQLGENHSCVGVTLNNLGELYEDEDKSKEAESALLRALKIAESDGPNNAHAAVTLNNLGSLYYSLHQMTTAEQYFRKALTAYQKSRPEDPQLREIMEVLLNLYQISHRYSDFRSLYVEFARNNANASPAGLLKAARIMSQRGDDFAKAGLNADAEAMYNRSLALFEAADQKESPDYKLVKERYVEFLIHLKRSDDAEKLKKQN